MVGAGIHTGYIKNVTKHDAAFVCAYDGTEIFVAKNLAQKLGDDLRKGVCVKVTYLDNGDSGKLPVATSIKLVTPETDSENESVVTVDVEQPEVVDLPPQRKRRERSTAEAGGGDVQERPAGKRPKKRKPANKHLKPYELGVEYDVVVSYVDAKGWGFAQAEGYVKIFFHVKSMPIGTDWECVKKGAKLKVVVEEGREPGQFAASEANFLEEFDSNVVNLDEHRTGTDG